MQAKDPTIETNLSKSLAPSQAIIAHSMTMKKRKTFFFHLIQGLYLPVLLNSCWLVISIAGYICNGVDSRIAKE